MAKVIVRDLAKKFMWTIVTGDSDSLNRPLTLADTNRPGLELAGYFPDTQTKRRSEERRVGKECRSRWSPYH